jgi:hypothetical protein
MAKIHCSASDGVKGIRPWGWCSCVAQRTCCGEPTVSEEWCAYCVLVCFLLKNIINSVGRDSHPFGSPQILQRPRLCLLPLRHRFCFVESVAKNKQRNSEPRWPEAGEKNTLRRTVCGKRDESSFSRFSAASRVMRTYLPLARFVLSPSRPLFSLLCGAMADEKLRAW